MGNNGTFCRFENRIGFETGGGGMVTPDDVTLTVGSSSRLIDWICAGSRLFSMEIKKEEKFAENPTGFLFFLPLFAG